MVKKQKKAASHYIEKMRSKLQEKIEKEHEILINKEALQKSMDSIRKWLQRHKTERVSLKDKNIQLFDRNAHSAKITNQFVRKLQEKIKSSS